MRVKIMGLYHGRCCSIMNTPYSMDTFPSKWHNLKPFKAIFYTEVNCSQVGHKMLTHLESIVSLFSWSILYMLSLVECGSVVEKIFITSHYYGTIFPFPFQIIKIYLHFLCKIIKIYMNPLYQSWIQVRIGPW